MVLSPVKTSISEGEEKLFSISYVRVSTRKQTGKSGFDRQDDEYIEWHETHPNYEDLGLEFRDSGVSGRGKNSEKGALASLLKEAKLGKFSFSDLYRCRKYESAK